MKSALRCPRAPRTSSSQARAPTMTPEPTVGARVVRRHKSVGGGDPVAPPPFLDPDVPVPGQKSRGFARDQAQAAPTAGQRGRAATGRSGGGAWGRGTCESQPPARQVRITRGFSPRKLAIFDLKRLGMTECKFLEVAQCNFLPICVCWRALSMAADAARHPLFEISVTF